MRLSKAAVVVAIALFPFIANAGDANECYVISNPDARALCRAKAHSDSSICYVIQDAGKRASCLSETR